MIPKERSHKTISSTNKFSHIKKDLGFSVDPKIDENLYESLNGFDINIDHVFFFFYGIKDIKPYRSGLYSILNCEWN